MGKANDKILDIGCGIGGSAFYMANHLRDMQPANVKHSCHFYVEDATLMDYPEGFYDMVYSRDTILHIKDKKDLFDKFFKALKPGGKVVITDYCHGDKPEHSVQFKEYVKSRGYILYTVEDYGNILASAGFVDVQARNM